MIIDVEVKESLESEEDFGTCFTDELLHGTEKCMMF